MPRKIITLLPILFLLFELSIPSEPSGFVVIVNQTNSVDKITKQELEKLFLKKERNWPDKTAVYPVDLKESKEVREKFTRYVFDKKVAAIKAYWQKQIFTGRGVPPPEKSNEVDVLEYIQKHDGAIGYISDRRKIRNYQVKVISIDEE